MSRGEASVVRRLPLWTAAALLLIPVGWFSVQQVREDILVAEYLQRNGLSDLPTTRASAIAVMNQVRADFNVDEDSFRSLDMSNRPFLREDTAFLLTHKEGLCGEGSRVLVNLLLQLGFDATRISLFKANFGSHSLVSVLLEGEEFLLDSINSTRRINDFLTSNRVSSRDFSLAYYHEDLATRRKQGAVHDRPTEEHDWFFNRFSTYSYEAIPLTKLSHALGLQSRTLVFERPPVFISKLAEKPRLLCALFWLLATLCLAAALHIVAETQGPKTLPRESEASPGHPPPSH